jgi:hypothetical protein
VEGYQNFRRKKTFLFLGLACGNDKQNILWYDFPFFFRKTAMYEVDRVVAIIKPTKKMLEWLHQKTDENKALALEDIRNDCTTLLIPPFESEEQAQQYMEEIYNDIFENELESWDPEQAHWPQSRSLDLFLAWFDIEYHSVVYDIANEPLRGESEQLQ